MTRRRKDGHLFFTTLAFWSNCYRFWSSASQKVARNGIHLKAIWEVLTAKTVSFLWEKDAGTGSPMETQEHSPSLGEEGKSCLQPCSERKQLKVNVLNISKGDADNSTFLPDSAALCFLKNNKGLDYSTGNSTFFRRIYYFNHSLTLILLENSTEEQFSPKKVARVCSSVPDEEILFCSSTALIFVFRLSFLKMRTNKYVKASPLVVYLNDPFRKP
ncbi:uncharacterized protein LOC131577667 [Poecile atricapillus]|uniref:uncharacterized protein LOC131577667 n=1 Tax=Poecile atricapillus TaxID=48891 RepID=UPI0027383D6F|nr:uncharacterized protein LOC131577667 [Poecile atricapillus]